MDPSGLAAADGRIRAGDQILQINGEEVQARDQAVALFAAGGTIALVVARPKVEVSKRVS